VALLFAINSVDRLLICVLCRNQMAPHSIKHIKDKHLAIKSPHTCSFPYLIFSKPQIFGFQPALVLACELPPDDAAERDAGAG
jgi:hypothetical protein